MKKQLQRWIQDKIGIGKNRDRIRILENKLAALSSIQEWSMPSVLNIPKVLLNPIISMLPPKYKSINLDIHRSDPMFRYPLQVHGPDTTKVLLEYFTTGLHAAELIEKHKPKAKRVLDFGAGFGRVGRFLFHVFPDAQILVSDPKKSALKYQTERLGAIADDEKIVDLIFAGSVFTHLPKSIFKKTLHGLMNRLEKGGLLILTMHQFVDQEFLFYSYTEESAMSHLEDALDDSNYGSVYCSKDFFEYCLYSHSRGSRFKYKIDDSSSFGGTQQYLIIEPM